MEPDEQADTERNLWNITPRKTVIELNDGKLRMREQVLHTGTVRVSKALQTRTDPHVCAWMYVTAESRDGADVTFTLDQAREMRDALDSCIEQTEAKLEEY
jgi:hypothetical protein